jgi:hypothetical protein
MMNLIVDNRVFLNTERSLSCCRSLEHQESRMVLVHIWHQLPVSLYINTAHRYCSGCLDSAYAAYIAGILINVVGFAGATGRTVPLAATCIYQMAFFTGFGVSSITYWLLNVVFPVLGKSVAFEEVDM